MTLSTAPNIQRAAEYLYYVTAQVNSIFQLSANAPADMIHETLFLEFTGAEDGDMCRETPFYAAPPYPDNTRLVDKDATAALIQALWGHAERPRITRAIVQYETAIGHWRDGSRPLVMMHLYMGVEALTEVMLRAELAARGITEQQLMNELDVGPNLPSSGTVLRGRIRLHRIFEGDVATYKQARTFSDGLEHGFGDESLLWGVPVDVQVKTARYLRKAIIELLDNDQTTKSLLLNSPYDQVVPPLPPPNYLTRVPVDELRWRESEFTVMGLLPTLGSAVYDQSQLEYKPDLIFKPPAIVDDSSSVD